MNIHFYLDDESETQIASFYDINSNPFKAGDQVCLSVEELYPVQLKSYNQEAKTNFFEKNKECIKNFHLKKVLLVKEGKYIKINTLGEDKLTIEYHCKFDNSEEEK